jgi:hypothetical protein
MIPTRFVDAIDAGYLVQIDMHVDEFRICGIVFMYQALYMMISYASIPCGIWLGYGIPRGA